MDSEDHDHRCRLWKVVDQLVADTNFHPTFPGSCAHESRNNHVQYSWHEKCLSTLSADLLLWDRNADSQHQTRYDIPLSSTGRIRRAPDDAASARRRRPKSTRSELEITPKPRQLAWARDIFGNHVATAHFVDQAAELRFVSNIRIDIRRPAFAKPISRILPATSRLPTRRKIGPVSNVSSCHRPGVPHLIVGARLSSARTDLPTRTSCSST